jgi:DNA-binding response OmpR family regulator
MKKDTKTQLGKILLKQQLVNSTELDALLEEQRIDNSRLASKALDKGLVDVTGLLRALSEQQGIPAVNLEELEIDLSALDMIPRDIAVKHIVLPIAVTKDAVNLAMANPEDQRVVDEIGFVSGKRVFPHVALHAQLVAMIEACYTAREAGEAVYRGPKLGKSMSVPPAVGGGFEVEPVGTVKAETENGNDFELSIEVDIGEDDLSSITPPPMPLVKETGAPRAQRSTSKKILVVDDEDEIRLLFSRVLTDKGYDVITASRGLEAIKKVQSENPQMIILDAMLPEVHGFDICKRIKGSSKYGHIPVIMISAIYRGWRYAQDLKDSYGVDEFIEKPFKISELIQKVEALMDVSVDKSPPPSDQLSKEAERILEECMNAYRSGQIDDAIVLLKQGIQIDPLAFKLHYHLALLLGRKNLNYQAIRSLESALELAPDYFPALKNLAVLYQKTGFKFKAIETWERALGYCEEEGMREKIKKHLMKLL